MSIKMQDIGEIGYGGLVTLSEWWDDRRIEQAQLTNKDIFKKASTYAYLVPGAICTLTSAFGWVRPLKPWDEHISHGFLYDFPRFMRNTVNAMRTERSSSSVVSEAQRILRERQRSQIPPRSQETHRYPAPPYQKQFEGVRLIG